MLAEYTIAVFLVGFILGVGVLWVASRYGIS